VDPRVDDIAPDLGWDLPLRLLSGLKAAEIELDRKVLADLAVVDPAKFGELVEQAKAALATAK